MFMLIMAGFFALMGVAYIGAYGLVATSLFLCVTKSREGKIKDATYLFLSSTALLVVLIGIPKHRYYVDYGIQSKAVLMLHVDRTLIAVGATLALCIQGKTKLPPLGAAILTLLLL